MAIKYKPATSHVKYLLSGSNSLVMHESTAVQKAKNNTAVGVVNCMNSGYVFKLDKSNGGAWLISELAKPMEPKSAEIQQRLSRDAEGIQHSLGTIIGLDGPVKIAELRNLQDFKLESATRSNEFESIVVKFSRTGRKPFDTIIQCEYTFDPNEKWLPTKWVETGTSAKASGVVVGKRSVTISDNTIEVSTEHTQRLVAPFADNTTRTGVFKAEYGVAIPESEFTLSAFGLPEPSGYKPPTTPLYMWLLLAAGVCAIVAIAFRLLARRRAA